MLFLGGHSRRLRVHFGQGAGAHSPVRPQRGEAHGGGRLGTLLLRVARTPRAGRAGGSGTTRARGQQGRPRVCTHTARLQPASRVSHTPYGTSRPHAVRPIQRAASCSRWGCCTPEPPCCGAPLPAAIHRPALPRRGAEWSRLSLITPACHQRVFLGTAAAGVRNARSLRVDAGQRSWGSGRSRVPAGEEALERGVCGAGGGGVTGEGVAEGGEEPPSHGGCPCLPGGAARGGLWVWGRWQGCVCVGAPTGVGLGAEAGHRGRALSYLHLWPSQGIFGFLFAPALPEGGTEASARLGRGADRGQSACSPRGGTEHAALCRWARLPAALGAQAVPSESRTRPSSHPLCPRGWSNGFCPVLALATPGGDPARGTTSSRGPPAPLPR